MAQVNEITDIDALRAAVRQGLSPKYLLFWGHRPLPDGSIGKGCLSQWWPSEFEVDGEPYATAEHFMMAEKARLFGDEATREKILAAPSPGAAKNLGRQVRDFQEHEWIAHRFDIVVRGNVAKFSQSAPLRYFLLGTRDRILVEASPQDRIWGIGLAESDSQARHPDQWQGLNLLGFALMEARGRLERGATS